MNLEEAKQKAENKKLLPTEKDFENKPGYWRKPAKVHRTGVGKVDGYEWGCDMSTKSKDAKELGEMIEPWARAEEKRCTKVEIQRRTTSFGYSRAYSEAPIWKDGDEELHLRSSSRGGKSRG